MVTSLPGGRKPQPTQRDLGAKQRQQDGQRLNSLEQEHAVLRAEL